MKCVSPRICLLAAIWLFDVAGAPIWAAQGTDRQVDVRIVDQQGLPVAGALVVLTARQGNVNKTAETSSGTVRIDGLAPEVYELRVQAAGFTTTTTTVDLRTESATSVEVRLEAAGIAEQIVVTATRSERPMNDIPASVSVVTREEIEASPALVADDVLRQVPTFSLFRRTSSLVAQPTTQGVSLRGIGPSGQSRTLVLLDGIPFNDPFGGWVYWTRVPLVSVDRIEVTEDTTSSLYGNYAMGGVINIITSRPRPRTIELKPQYGSRGSRKFDFFASDRWNTLSAAVEGSVFNSDGFPIVAPRERGPIDNNADVDYRNVSVKFDYTPTDRVNAFFRTGYFTEDRGNGKVGEVNDTRWTTVNGGVELRMPDDSNLQARMFVDHQKAHFNFLAVNNAATTRDIVRLATDQFVPTNGVGSTILWTKPVSRMHVFSAGLDWRWVDGDSREDAYVATEPAVIIPPVTRQATLSLKRISGGTQQSRGVLVQDIFTPISKLVFTLSARADRWRNYDGHNLETEVATGQPTANNNPSLPDKTDTVVSPHAAALYHVSAALSVWGAANSGFRAPTLTELYRQFSVNTVTTRPNDQLGPERLVGGEAGVKIAPARNMTARVTWFDNRVRNPVSNVTLSPTRAQKQNLGRTRIRGVQSDVDYRVGSSWRVSGAYVYEEAKVTDGGLANAALVGKYLAQVPKQRGSIQIAYSNSTYASLALGIQFIGLQYNDDQNVNFIPAATLTEAGYDAALGPGLPGYATVDLTASRDVGRNLQLFFGVQNLFNQAYFVQTSPSTTGTPRLVNGGVSWRFTGR
jgi:outer membrane receptor protein involved in Fe transport